jgi:short subunit dehydrogenase-like uncharacterized protein
VVLASGYDSIPFDLGALHALESFADKHGGAVAPSEITALVTRSRGWMSGGTLASAIKTAQLIWSGGVSQASVSDPYLLVPQDDAGVVGACRSDSSVSGWGGAFPRFDRDVRSLGVPHFMAAINARVVRRSLAIFGLRNVSYAEGLSLGAMADMTWWITLKVLRGEFPLSALAPKPGDGPSPVATREGSGRVEFVVKAATPKAPSPTSPTGDAFFVRTEVAYVGDPGYNATSRMLAEAGLCLATPSCHLADPQGTTAAKQSSPSVLQKFVRSVERSHEGGVLTTATAMGMGLVRRLEAADGGRFMTFRVLS